MAASKPAYGSTDGPYIDNPNAAPVEDNPVVTTGMNPQPEQPQVVDQRLDEGTPGGKYSVDGRLVDAQGRAISDAPVASEGTSA